MLEEQLRQSFWSRALDKLKLELGFEKFGFKAKISADSLDLYRRQSQLDRALKNLETEGIVGTIENPSSWFKAELEMKWGAFQNYAADLVLFAGMSDRTIVCLIGSIYSLVGWSNDKDANHSIDYYALKYFEAISGENPWGDFSGAVPDENTLLSEHDEIIAKTMGIRRVVREMAIPPRKVEFVAKRIVADTTKSLTILVGSPLYVALSE